jgi:protein-S-isoprenylcysteine O-methyltransferase Ste14
LETLSKIERPADNRPQLGLQIGRLKLSEGSAVLGLFVLLVLLAAFLAYIKPTLRMSVAAAIWMAFTVYWSAAARNAGPSRSTEPRASRAVHLRLLYGSLLLLFVPVPGLRQRFVPLTSLVVAVGFVMEILLALFAVWARRRLGRNWSGAITVTQNQTLVSSGPYRVIRHPIYTGILGMYVGTALVSGEVHALIAVAMISFAYWRKIRLEEETLRETFGPAYDTYRRRTWALVPWLH